MNLKNRPPVFVPYEFQTEIEKLSKAVLMDIAWDYAKQIAGGDEAGPDAVMRELRVRANLILAYRTVAA